MKDFNCKTIKSQIESEPLSLRIKKKTNLKNFSIGDANRTKKMIKKNLWLHLFYATVEGMLSRGIEDSIEGACYWLTHVNSSKYNNSTIESRMNDFEWMVKILRMGINGGDNIYWDSSLLNEEYLFMAKYLSEKYGDEWCESETLDWDAVLAMRKCGVRLFNKEIKETWQGLCRRTPYMPK